MELEFGFGATTQTVEIDPKNLMGVLCANEVVPPESEEAEIKRALREPIGAIALSEMDLSNKKIAIITSDLTRPMPTYKVMPVLLDTLYAAGATANNITLVFALGSHRKHTSEEMEKLAGQRAWKEITCVDSDPHDCIHLGTTSAGTPVDITRVVAEADFRICLGNIEFHYFAGYSGGAKAIMPGVSTRDAIQANHSMMVREEACAGNLDTNPIRLDIEEAGNICGIDYKIVPLTVRNVAFLKASVGRTLIGVQPAFVIALGGGSVFECKIRSALNRAFVFLDCKICLGSSTFCPKGDIFCAVLINIQIDLLELCCLPCV